eukprot:gnl/MRDRNA2_/MRDRNA2_249998_c0_seq1.p1 gnl/MRDRNA2_/MRDRNA2_249998_c0~~gnl/MRDRNA2_/MRDRNA2_249998_c0_seq1.p1  ORF type:complete len:469 (-),score=67.01 gnl/MRDRNA2_/MRDRNA2_249998_c0_seq1:106-1512(-)
MLQWTSYCIVSFTAGQRSTVILVTSIQFPSYVTASSLSNSIPNVSAPHHDGHSICASAQHMSSDLQQYGLPNVVSVNWGQWHGPYKLPPERLVICADGKGFLWTQTKQESGSVISMDILGPSQIMHLFQLILTKWPQGLYDRKSADGKFIWLLDADFNFIIAPVMQARGLHGAIEEVKHGDLTPGVKFFGDHAAAGPYRGVARFGGEFNLAGLRDGREWIMHAKSGYTAYRVPVQKAKEYYDAMHKSGLKDPEIARNFQRCVVRDIFRARMPLTRLFCYLRRHFRIEATLGVTQQCDIRMKLVEGLPNLAECAPKKFSLPEVCGAESDIREGAPIVNLVDWYAPGQDRCNHTLGEYEALIQNVADNIKTFLEFHPSVASSSGGRSYAKGISKKIRLLRKHACLWTESFAQQLHCNVHGCFGEGFTQDLKKVESSFGGVLPERQELDALWKKTLRRWAYCKRGRIDDEL